MRCAFMKWSTVIGLLVATVGVGHMLSRTFVQRYYRWAGVLALPCMGVPLIQLHVFHVFNYEVAFYFGTIGLLFAVSGISKGQKGGRICAAIALLLFAYLTAFYVYINHHMAVA